jgi:sterol 3beta-glucosyltransferase
MRIALVTLGTRGDTQPFAVLSAELARRGHDVVMGTQANTQRFGQQLNVHTEAVDFDSMLFLRTDAGRRWLSSRDTLGYASGVRDVKRSIGERLQKSLLEVTAGADLIITSKHAEDEIACIAEARDTPAVCMFFAPLRDNDAFPGFIGDTRRLSAEENRKSHAYSRRVEWQLMAEYVNDFREKLGLPYTIESTAARLENMGALEIQAYSRHLVPELANWSPNRPLVGSIRLGDGQRLSLGETADDESLLEWIAADTPPAYFGFGSMPVRDVHATLSMIDRVSRNIGVRALVSAGWNDISAGEVDSSRIRLVNSVNHGAILPRCCMAIHHGGSGTTAASIEAGLPTVVCSVFSDQPFWGSQLERLGAGAALRFADLNEEDLTGAAWQMLLPEYRDRAQELGAALRKENAVAHAATLIEGQINEVRR